jgi:anti-sigma-K factor RskA
VTNEHPYREGDFDLYALGVLEGDELHEIESHLATCTACTKELAEARGRIALLALSAEPREPSIAVRQRLLAKVRAEKDPSRATSLAKTGRAPSRFWNFAFGIAALALAVLAVFLWDSNERIRRDLEHQEALARQQIVAVERARAIAKMMMSPQTVTINLAPKAPMATEPGRVLYNSQLGALIYGGTLPQLAPGKSYELWVIPQTGNPIPAGVFSADPDGQVNDVMPKIPVGVSAKAFAVTIEPAGGTAAPTGPMAQIGAGL